MSNKNKEISIYIHWPYCLKKCPYCDFNSHVASSQINIKEWEEAYKNEIDSEQNMLGKRKVKSIFFGGGTPSLMPPYLVESILQYIQKKWTFSDNIEITLEANPSSVEIENFKSLYEAGINRLSLGFQSLNNSSLNFLGRNHSAEDSLKALEIAKQYFNRISFDLIYGLPGQNEKNWEKELKEAINISTEHMSAYQLTIEKGTSFYASFRDKKYTLPEEKVLLNLYTITDELLMSVKLEKYEISNYAYIGSECVHNLDIWKGGEYCGIGPGAHGRIKINKKWRSTQKFPSPKIWLAKNLSKQTALFENTKITDNERAQEILLTGLRLRKGINIKSLLNELNIKDDNIIIDKKEFKKFNQLGLIEMNKELLRITDKGVPILNHITNKLIL